MNKAAKAIIAVFIVLVLGLIVFIAGGHKQLVMSMSEVEELKTTLSNKDDMIRDYKTESSALEEAVKDLEEKNKALQSEVDSLMNTEEESTDDVLASLDMMTFELSSHLIYDHMLLDLSLSEDRALELLGQPKNEIVEVFDEDDIWYLEGFYGKEAIYDDVSLFYHGDKNGENYDLVAVSTTSDVLYLLDGTKVGDSLDDLKEKYPILLENTWTKDQEIYFYPYRYDGRAIDFEIDDNKIIRMTIGVMFD